MRLAPEPPEAFDVAYRLRGLNEELRGTRRASWLRSSALKRWHRAVCESDTAEARHQINAYLDLFTFADRETD